MSEKMRPSRPLLAVLPGLLALAAGAGGFWLFSRPAMSPEEVALALGPDPVPARETSALEVKTYLAEFPEAYLLSPPLASHLPCPVGVQIVDPDFAARVASALNSDNPISALGALHRRYTVGGWLPGLALAQEQALAERPREAEQVIRDLASWQAWPTGNDRDSARARMHGEFLEAYLRLERNVRGDELWKLLKRPIWRTRFVGADPSWIEHPLPGPGCPPDRGEELSTFDLYNNLIAGYLRGSFSGNAEGRESESERPYDDPPNRNPLQFTLNRIAKPWPQDHESRVWALSNAERLLRERISEDGELTPPPIAHLNLNLAQLYEWVEVEGLALATAATSSSSEKGAPVRRKVDPEAPDPAAIEKEVLPALRAQARALRTAALSQRETVAEDDRQKFDRAYARVALAAASRDGAMPDLPEAVRAQLNAEQKENADHLSRAIEVRRDTKAWAALALRNEGDGAFLGAQRDEWRLASRRDIATELARRAEKVEPAERTTWRNRAFAVLALNDPPPDELKGDEGLGLFKVRKLLGTGIGAWVAAALAALLAWIIGRWLSRELRRRADLFTSFYAWDYERKIGPVGRPGRRRPD